MTLNRNPKPKSVDLNQFTAKRISLEQRKSFDTPLSNIYADISLKKGGGLSHEETKQCMQKL